MKLAIRMIALSIVIAGAAAAATTQKSTTVLPSRQSATDTMPGPVCSPHLGCPTNPASGN